MSQQSQEDGSTPPGGDAIDLSCLPRKGLVKKARRVLAAIAAGAQYMTFRGVRLKEDRTLIRIPLGPHWRLLFRDADGRLVPIVCMSHATYDHRRARR